jgi:hypothetical protein
MAPRAEEFHRLVAAVLRRFFAQNGQPGPEPAAVARFCGRLWAMLAARGLPAPLGPGERGQPVEMPESECTALLSQALDPGADPLLAEAARQLLKACFYPEFRVCRESYRATGPDGACRRQDPARAQRRVSGTHCVDCPYWQTFAGAEHAQFLAERWCSGAADFQARRDIFLPEDFRALRCWIRAEARG